MSQQHSATTEAVVPLGRPIGWVRQAGQASFHVRRGPRDVMLPPDLAHLWLALHTGADMLPLCWYTVAGVEIAPPPTAQQFSELRSHGVATTFCAMDPRDRRNFLLDHRLVPLQTVSAELRGKGVFALIASGDATTGITTGVREMFVHSPRFGDLRDVVMHRIEPIAAAMDDRGVPTKDVGVRLTIAVSFLLHASAAYLDEPVFARAEQIDPSTVASDGDTSSAGLFAVGYAGGPRDGMRGSIDVFVRTGEFEHRLPRAELLTWTAAHGASKLGRLRFDRKTVLKYAAKIGANDPDAALHRLMESGVVIEPIGDAEIIRFAATHRLDALLGGYADVPGRHWLGTYKNPELIELPGEEFAVWRDAPTAPTLLDAAHHLGFGATSAGLRRLLAIVQRLVAKRVAYLDHEPDPEHNRVTYEVAGELRPMDEVSSAERLHTSTDERQRLARAARLVDDPVSAPPVDATNTPSPVAAEPLPEEASPPPAAPDLGDPVKVRAPTDDDVSDDFIARFGDPRKPDKPAEASAETDAADPALAPAPAAEAEPAPQSALVPEETAPEEHEDQTLPTAVPWTSPMSQAGSQIVVLPMGQHSYYIPPDTGTLPRLSEDELTVWSAAEVMLSPRELIAQANEWVTDAEPIYHRLVECGHLREIDLGDHAALEAALNVSVHVNWRPEGYAADHMVDDPVGAGLPRDLHYLIVSCLRDRSLAKAVNVMKLYHGSEPERMRTAFIRLWPLVPNSLISFMPYPQAPAQLQGTFGNPMHADEWSSLDKPWDLPGTWAPLDMDGERA